jgi:hypothetical protein
MSYTQSFLNVHFLAKSSTVHPEFTNGVTLLQTPAYHLFGTTLAYVSSPIATLAHMRLGGEDDGSSPPPGGDPPAASAYPASANRQHRLFAAVVAFFVVLVLRSHFTRDYRGEAETYLRANGREVCLRAQLLQ